MLSCYSNKACDLYKTGNASLTSSNSVVNFLSRTPIGRS